MKLIKEHINFKRGQDPLDAMNIGNRYETWWANLKEGDCFKLIKDLPSLGYKKGMHVRITRYTGIRTYYEDKKERKCLRCDKYYSFEDLKNDINILSGSGMEWRWTLDFMKECFVKIYLNESVNFERNQDPFKAMAIGKNRPEYTFQNIKVGDIYRLKKDIPSFNYSKGMYTLITNTNARPGEDNDTQKWVKCTRGDYNLEDVIRTAPKNIKAQTGEVWGWPYPFFKDFFDKINHVVINEVVNFEEDKD